MEKRIIEGKVELRTEDDKTFIEGVGIVFGVESKNLGGFTEVITPDALKNADMSDIIVRAEHDNNYVLGRTRSGTAEVVIKEDGVSYRAEKPNTTAGNDVAEYIRRGDLVGSSFAFSGVKDKWEERKDGSVLRTINSIDKIYDLGPVFNPAYAQTDFKVALRSMEEWKKEKEIEKKPEERKQIGLSLSKRIWLLKAKSRNNK